MRLQSGRLAVVVEQNPRDLVAPVVKVFFSTKSQMHVVPMRLELSRSADRIVGREGREGPDGRFPHLDELWADPEVLHRLKR